jgi:hypothetical protein
MAVASLVLGIVGLFFVSPVFGFSALNQIRERGDRGRGMAVAGLVLSGVWLVLVGAFAISQLSVTAQRNEAGQVSRDGKLTVTDLKGQARPLLPLSHRGLVAVG